MSAKICRNQASDIRAKNAWNIWAVLFIQATYRKKIKNFYTILMTYD